MINNGATPLTRQILQLSEQGMTPEQICEAFPDLALEPAAVVLAIRTATSNKRVNLDQVVDELGGEMVEILADIARDSKANDSARVKAATCLLERRGCLPLIDADEFSERFRRMQELKKANDEKIVKFAVAA